MRGVTVDIGTGKRCPNDRICVDWIGFDRDCVDAIKNVPGRSYVKTPHKHWHVPLDLETCRSLREAFGEYLTIGEELVRWARAEVRQEKAMMSIAEKETAALVRLPKIMPALYDAIHLGPAGRFMTFEERAAARLGPASYQAADVEFLVQSNAALNANEQGLGKTIEWIAAVWEAGIEEGDHLVICPKTAADATWESELSKWQAEVLEQVGIFMCVEEGRESREAVIQRWLQCELPTRWVIVNPAMLTLRKEAPDFEYDEDWKPYKRLPGTAPHVLAVKGPKKEQWACRCRAMRGPHEHYDRPFPELYEYKWRSICIDEAHKGVIRNHKNITYKSLLDLQLTDDGKKCVMTGTPMKKFGGADIWGILSYLRPDIFTSYWRIAEGYFEVTSNGFGKRVGGLRKDKEESFFRMLIPYVLRRTKKEVAPWLPDKLYVDVDVRMSTRQAQQYRRMEEEAWTTLGVNEVVAGGNLARITRMKQFANAHSKVDTNGDIIPIYSPKLEAMLGKFEERGMFDENREAKALVFSQSRRMVDFIAERLRKEGLETLVISGKTRNRRAVKEAFQDGTAQVLVIVTTAGGTSLTLDAADDVHLIDELWDPGEDEQAEDRAHRVSRIHQVTVFTYRTLGTIDEDIAMTKWEKKETHSLILDIRRKALARTHVTQDSGEL
jgi:SNF2 family DNA or RNA helicase